MTRLILSLIVFSGAISNSFADCKAPDIHPLASKRWINEKSVPPGVEVFDRVWLKNPTSTELILFTPELGAAKRTAYREVLGPMPTTDNELPNTKLVDGNRYEFHSALQPGWMRQDYPAALLEGKTPLVPIDREKKLLEGKLSVLEIRVTTPLYFGKKKYSTELIYEFRKNKNYAAGAPGCK